MNKPRWLLLTHQLPAHPSNVRVKVWRKLQGLGAVPIKNSIYVLPNRPGTREDFEWLRKGIIQMKGEASVFIADSITDLDENDILKAFQEARSKDYERFIHRTKALIEDLRSVIGIGHIPDESLSRLEKEWTGQKIEREHLEKIDFFHAPNHDKADVQAAKAQELFQEAKALSRKGIPEPPPPLEIKNLKGRLWLTRTSPHIDRLACAWLIRRFIDSKAQFKFVTEPYRERHAREVRFDMAEGEFTHFGEWCSFETFLHRLMFKDSALEELAEIIHDIDLKDKKFARPEASGLSQIIRGLCRIHKDDAARLGAGMVIFDALHASLVSHDGGNKK